MAINPLSPTQLRQLVQDARAAIERLSSGSEGEPASDPQKSNIFDRMAAELMSKIDEVKARLGGTQDESVPTHAIDDKKIRELEDALWFEYKLKGEVIPDELLKECQRRLRIASPESRTEMDLRDQLSVLDAIHRYRKGGSIRAFFQPGGHWTKAKAVDPPTEMKRGHNFWALIIGNNAYPRAPLGGCINDTVLLHQFLREYLGVPSNHIRLLTDATRQSIVDALYDLRDNPKIQKGDNILIHFSGHGSSYNPREYFTTTPSRAGSIEALCPVDRGPTVPDISDRELNLILSEIGAEKGSNITLVLDCCHSAGAVRSIIATDTVRYIPPLRGFPALNLQMMLEAADNNPRRRPTSPLATTETWEADISSFVTLAACHDYQLAEECNVNSSYVDVDDIQVRGYGDGSDTDDVALSFATEFLPRGPMRPTVAGPKPKMTDKASHQKPNKEPKKVQQKPKVPVRHGRFTWALVKILQSELAGRVTYESLIKSIGSLGPLQQPVVVGSRKSLKLWFDNANS